MSAGNNDYGILGQGKDVKQSKSFRPMKLEGEMEFAQISVYERQTLGITTEGKLYGWGYNENRMLGFE